GVCGGVFFSGGRRHTRFSRDWISDVCSSDLPLLQWAWLAADFVGTSRADCRSGGACWVFVREHLPQFLYGFYPAGERWRVNLGICLLLVPGLSLLVARPGQLRRGWGVALLAYSRA